MGTIFNTLYARLAAVLVILLGALAAMYILLTLYTTRLYQEQVTQSLNRTLAENLVANKALIHDGKVDKAMLDEIFHMYMVINPSIEVYLIDTTGRILAYSAPPEKIKRNSVSMAAISEFMQHAAALPILGDDPRNPEGKKIFSAAPVKSDGHVDGYLYVVLAGQEYESIAGLFHSSYIVKLSTGVITTSLVFGVIAGLLIFNLLTRRLRRLSNAMEDFQQHNFETPVPAELTENPGQDEIGRLSKTFKYMSDRISEQVTALRQTDALRRELIANVSHDLRTPIASLQGFLETLLLKENGLTPAQRSAYLNTALKHSERLNRLTNELFELSRLDSGDIKPHPEAFALGDLVQDIIMKFKLTADEKHIRLQSRMPRELPLAYGDIALIERVLQNLLENALHHTPPDGEVFLALSQSDHQLNVTVSDTGRGIPPDKLGRIFDRFFQVEKNEHNHTGGAGLGLAIAKRIVTLHGGDIQVESRLDHGTSFSFPVPVWQS
jgi:two-component system OmpR family sensor kinase